MGSTSIQLAKAAGYTVATTASARNEDYVRRLGATHFFDYAQAGVVDQMAETLRGGNFAGVFDCISEEGTVRSCAEILSRLGGGVLPLTLWAPEGLPGNIEAVQGESTMFDPNGPRKFLTTHSECSCSHIAGSSYRCGGMGEFCTSSSGPGNATGQT